VPTNEFIAGNTDMATAFLQEVIVGSKMVINIKSLSKKLICFDVRGKTFITDMVNDLERD
jgi:hypothetical protein